MTVPSYFGFVARGKCKSPLARAFCLPSPIGKKFWDGCIIRQLLASRLHGKITLPQCDKRFAWISVLDDEIAGVAGERPIFESALCARADINHFGDINEMVANRMAALCASFTSFRYDGDEIAKVGVFQYPRQFTSGPKLATAFVGALDTLERVARGGNWRLAGLNLSVSSLVGFMALFGIAMLNGVVLVERIRELRGRGRPVSQAIREGAMSRVRPVMMTALMAALGLLPMALSREVGAETSRPFAVVIIGGLVTSTLVTLLILPLLYPWFETGKGAVASEPDSP